MASTPRVLHLIPILVVVLSFHLIVCVSFCGVAAGFCPRPVASTHATPRHHGTAAFCINACHATDDPPRLVLLPQMRCDRRRRSSRPRPRPSAEYMGRLSVRVPQLEREEVALLVGQTVFKGAVEAHPELNDPSTFARANILPLASRRARPVPSASFSTCPSRSASMLRLSSFPAPHVPR